MENAGGVFFRPENQKDYAREMGAIPVLRRAEKACGKNSITIP
jgi:hypothetical protein